MKTIAALFDLRTAIFLIGLGSLTSGLAMVNLAAALIVPGVSLCALAVLPFVLSRKGKT